MIDTATKFTVPLSADPSRGGNDMQSPRSQPVLARIFTYDFPTAPEVNPERNWPVNSGLCHSCVRALNIFQLQIGHTTSVWELGDSTNSFGIFYQRALPGFAEDRFEPTGRELYSARSSGCAVSVE